MSDLRERGSDLTTLQTQVLNAVGNWILLNSYPPSFQDLAIELGHNSTNAVRKAVEALKTKGYIERVSGASRAMRLSQAAWSIVKEAGR